MTFWIHGAFSHEHKCPTHGMPLFAWRRVGKFECPHRACFYTVRHPEDDKWTHLLEYLAIDVEADDWENTKYSVGEAVTKPTNHYYACETGEYCKCIRFISEMEANECGCIEEDDESIRTRCRECGSPLVALDINTQEEIR